MKIGSVNNSSLLQGPALVAAVLTVGPALCVLAWRWSGPMNPQSAVAESAAQPPAPIAPCTLPKTTEEQKQTAEAAEAAIQKGFGDSPLTLPPATPPPIVVQAPTTTARSVDSLTLSSIMSTARGPMAVIGGKVRYVGDEVAKGWTVATINPEANSVTLSGPDSVKSTLTLPKPKHK